MSDALQPSTQPRVAIIGDVGGHRAALQRELERLGVRGDHVLPEGLTVVQVGDLVHRGPDSAGVVELVDSVMRENAGREGCGWVQLCGNHEQLYVADAVFQWREELDKVTVATLRRWWSEGTMTLAWAFETAGLEVRRAGGVRERIGSGGVLVTHAGLTHGAWVELGRPGSAAEAAASINAERHDHSSVVWATGRMLDPQVSLRAGVVWAEAGAEVLGSWRSCAESPGFAQVHGHSSPFSFRDGGWRSEAARRAGDTTHVDTESRITRCEVRGQIIWGCDPQHGRDEAHSWRALEFPVST